MNLPTTSNIWIIFFISGAFFIYLGINESNQHHKEIELLNTEVLDIAKKSTLNTQISLDETRFLGEKIGEVKDDSRISNDVKIEKMQEIMEQINLSKHQVDILNRNSDNAMDILESKIKIKELVFGFNKWIYIGSTVLGFILVVFGFNKLEINQKYRDKLLRAEHIKMKVYSNICQSCSMNLVDDIDHDGLSNFCSFCYTNGKFNHDLNIDDFKILINDQLVINKFTDKEITKRLKLIDNLRRWVNKLDWKNV